MVIESGLITTRSKMLISNLKQLKPIQSPLSPRRHMAIENFGHRLTSMCGCCMGKPSNGNQSFLVPLIFGVLLCFSI